MSSDVSDTKYQLTTKRRFPLLNHVCSRNEVSIETDVSRAWTSLLKMPVNYSFQGSGFICSKTNKKFCARFRSSHTIWDKIFQDKSDGRQTFQEESYYNFQQTYVFCGKMTSQWTVGPAKTHRAERPLTSQGGPESKDTTSPSGVLELQPHISTHFILSVNWTALKWTRQNGSPNL